MDESKRSPRAALAACALAGAAAALSEVLRALADTHAPSPAYAAWCALLVIGGSALLAPLAWAFARLSAALFFVPWLAAAGLLVHGWPGALAFALVGALAGAAARRAEPALAPWAAACGALFEATGSHASRFTSLIDAGVVDAAGLALLQHAVACALALLAATWLLGRARVRAAPVLATGAVLLCAAAFALRDLRAAPETEAPATRADPAAGPSVLLVVLDTVRADHTSVHGYARRTTPELERLLAARPGARKFDAAYANGSWTVPGHASLLSGQLPSRHGADFAGLQKGQPLAVGIAPEVPMLAELAQARGSRTFAVFANRWLRTAVGFRRGFADFERVEPRAEVGPLGDTLRLALVPGLRAGEMTSWGGAEFVSRKLLARLDALGGARFFGVVNYMDAHGPHGPPSTGAGTFGPWSLLDAPRLLRPDNASELNQRLMDRYDEQILHLDRELGRLFGELERRGILDRAWVIVTADHGEAFGEHGVADHGSGVFEEIVRVPLLVFPPRGVALESDDAPVSQVDVAATIAATLELPYDGPGRDLRGARGEGLVLVQHGAEPFRSDHCGALAGKDARAVRRGHWKLLDIAGELRLYDLGADPGETRDLAAERPELVKELSGLLPERMLRATPVGRGNAPSSAEEDRLRGIGY